MQTWFTVYCALGGERKSFFVSFFGTRQKDWERNADGLSAFADAQNAQKIIIVIEINLVMQQKTSASSWYRGFST